MSNPLDVLANGALNMAVGVVLWFMARIMFWLAGYSLTINIERLKQEDEA